MIQVDWGLLKMQYEILGISVEDLAEEYQIAPRVLKYAAEEKGWKRSSIAASTQEYGIDASGTSGTPKGDLTQLRNVPQEPRSGICEERPQTSLMPGHPNPDLPPSPSEGGSCTDRTPVTGKMDLATSIDENQSLLRAVKQATLSPKYIILESSLLGKCISLISQLPSDDPTVAPALKHICDIYKTLTEANVAQPKPAAEHSAPGGMTLNIMNRVAVTDGEGGSETLTVQVDGNPVGGDTDGRAA